MVGGDDDSTDYLIDNPDPEFGASNWIVEPGNTSDDLLEGGGGNDFLITNGGEDRLFGGTGNDYLYGGAHGEKLLARLVLPWMGFVSEADRAGPRCSVHARQGGAI